MTYLVTKQDNTMSKTTYSLFFTELQDKKLQHHIEKNYNNIKNIFRIISDIFNKFTENSRDGDMLTYYMLIDDYNEFEKYANTINFLYYFCITILHKLNRKVGYNDSMEKYMDYFAIKIKQLTPCSLIEDDDSDDDETINLNDTETMDELAACEYQLTIKMTGSINQISEFIKDHSKKYTNKYDCEYNITLKK